MNIKGYNLIVKWSAEDECFVGTCPELFSGGCHGDDESATNAELEVIVEDVLADFKKAGRAAPLPSTRTARTSSALPARVSSKLNQEQFAQAIGVPVGTVRNWEQKRSSPRGAARTLLRLIEFKPETIHGLRKLHCEEPTTSVSTGCHKKKGGLKPRAKKVATRYFKNKAGVKAAVKG